MVSSRKEEEEEEERARRMEGEVSHPSRWWDEGVGE